MIFESLQVFRKRDIEHVSDLYFALSEIYESGQGTLKYKYSDLHYLYSLRARINKPEYKKLLADFIKEMENTGNKITVDVNTKDIKFLIFLTGIITLRNKPE
jgi:hypothetical protein